MDDVLAKALRKKRILEDELEELVRFIATYRRLSGTNTENEEPFEPVDSENKSADSPPTVRKRHGRPEQFARIMEGVLKDVGRPLNRNAMVAEIELRGVEIPSADKPRYVGTILWRERSKFIHIVDHGYWLKYRDLPEIGYQYDTYPKQWLADATNVSVAKYVNHRLPGLDKPE